METTPRSLSIRVAIISSLVITAGFVVLMYFYLDRISWALAAAVFVFSGLSSFFIFQYTMQKFIYKKIKLIYKNIHTEKITKNKPRSVNPTNDVLSEVNQEVSNWAAGKRREIEELKRQETFRREFIGNVSHELKTPIFNMQGYILTLLEGGLEDPKINRDYLKKAEKNVDRMIAIVEELDAIGRFESGEVLPDMEKMDIVALTRDVMEMQEFKAKQYDIKLKFKEDYDKPIWVLAEKNRIRQVLTNLVVNSINYGKKGGETEVRFYDMDENILIEVADTGIGIAKEHLPRLFERFYRVDKSRSRDRGGTGLGLAIVKHIIEAHGQTINVRSTPGVGATFSFTLSKA